MFLKCGQVHFEWLPSATDTHLPHYRNEDFSTEESRNYSNLLQTQIVIAVFAEGRGALQRVHHASHNLSDHFTPGITLDKRH